MTPATAPRGAEVWLLLATFLVAAAGLTYELLAATASSYLLGDSVRQFSLVIGVYLAAMGLGAWASRFVAAPVAGFVWIQIALGLIGGFMAPMLFASYAFAGVVQGPLYLLLILTGALSGMEIPLIARVLKDIGAPVFRFENVLSVDYVGALVASVAFPLLIVPQLGLMTGSLAVGLMNLAVAGFSLWLFRGWLGRGIVITWALSLVLTLGGLVQAERMVSVTESALYDDSVIYSAASPYQHITLTRFRDRTRLFLDASVQFDSQDEYRYHEMLVQPAMALAPRRNRILILGGGDGLAAREVLRHADVEQVTLVDLDPMVTQLFQTNADLVALNHGALNDPRLRVLNQDAWQFVEHDTTAFDLIIVDLPDPKSVSLSRLYSQEFYALTAERLSAQGIMVVQSGSPLFARQAYWSVVHTLAATRNPVVPGAGLSVLPYHVYIPSFGEWGFTLVTFHPLASRPPTFPDGLRYASAATWQASQVFAPDMADLPAAVNQLETQPLLGYYNDGWDAWFN
ncbi:polyamine aminopropyltransferase [Pararhodobacter zhoushanensis]|uniref:Polyamine aminopropyltransferase n=1 Tax=Pararhodobacter zhoushanensis TaxID=2479545 RepID=A0ABT3H235_9RHOB|nr:polyamine aminopropyltransferase [Pararhodobacter zhoushanensis]MCW1933750.1 polyamine aminopropyltransferase [Pararhodobacter zhoushanensis]